MEAAVLRLANSTYKLRATFYAVTPWETPLGSLDQVPEVINSNFPVFILFLITEAIVIFASPSNRNKWSEYFEINDAITSFTSGVISRLPDLFMHSVEITTYVWVYTRFHIVEMPVLSIWTWLIAILGCDLGFYWFHRAAHEINLLWFFHQPHHSSEHYNISTAFRKGIFQRFANALFYLPMALLVPPTVFAIHVQLNLIYQIWSHTRLIGRVWWPVEFIFNTASHHRVHHGRNPYCIDKNYGGFLIIWDRLFGTFEAERDEEPVVYGLVHNLNTFDPIYVQFNHLKDILSRVTKANGIYEIFCIFVKGPGWNRKKPHLRLGDKDDLPEVEANPKRFSPSLPMWIQVYSLIHFAGIALWTGRVFELPGHLPVEIALIVSMVAVFTACSFGNFYNRRDWLSANFELVRCLVFAVGAPWLLQNCSFTNRYFHIGMQTFFAMSSVPWLVKVVTARKIKSE